MTQDEHTVPLGQESNLDLICEHLEEVTDILSTFEASLALIAAGLDLLPAGRCAHHYREALLEVRGEVDRLLAATGDA